MHTSTYVYHHEEEELHGFLAYNSDNKGLCPAILIAHDWSGCNQFACQKAKMLAEMGYVGFALDMYGQGRIGETTEEKMALITPFMANRKKLAARMRAAFDTVSILPQVDSNKIAAIGYCFGGLCVLDLARSGAQLRGVVSFHGLLDKPEHMANQSIVAKILVLHGFDDPMVRPDAVNKFCQEMTEAKVDWQVYQYSQTQHAFMNPAAHDTTLGTVYNARTERRALQSMTNFLQEIM